MAQKPTPASTLLKAATILERIAEKIGEQPPIVHSVGGGDFHDYCKRAALAAKYMGAPVRAVFNQWDAVVQPGMDADAIKTAMGYNAGGQL